MYLFVSIFESIYEHGSSVLQRQFASLNPKIDFSGCIHRELAYKSHANFNPENNIFQSCFVNYWDGG